jgi:hypothetical protein
MCGGFPSDGVLRMDRKLARKFHFDPVNRRLLIMKLFTSADNGEVEAIRAT